MSDLPAESQAQDEIKLIDLLLVLAEHWRLLVIGPLAVGLLALVIAFVMPVTYTATTKILPPQQQGASAAALLASQLGPLGAFAGAAGLGIKNTADTYVGLIRSRSIGDRLVERFKLLEVYDVKYREQARKVLEKSTSVQSDRGGMITIEVDDEDPKRAAEMANGYVEELSRVTDRLAITEAQQRRVFFEKQLQQAQANLKKSEFALSQVGTGEALIKSTPHAVVEQIARLKAQVTALEVRLATMRGYLTESNPEYVLGQRELASLRAQITEAERDQPAKGESNSDYLNRFRDFKYQETLFELIAKQYEMARLDEAREGAVVQVVDFAQPPERKSKPRRGIIAILATIGAFFVLLLAIYVRHTWNALAGESQFADKASRLRRLLAWRR